MLDLNGKEIANGDKVVVINKMHNELCHGVVIEAREKTCDVTYTVSLGIAKTNRFNPLQLLKVS